MNWLKKFYTQDYQHWTFWAAQADGEYAKIGRFLTPTFTLLTFLRVSGVVIRFWEICLAYLIIYTLAVVIGWWLVKLGVVSYNTRLGNDQNPQIQQILKQQEEILNKINGK